MSSWLQLFGQATFFGRRAALSSLCWVRFRGWGGHRKLAGREGHPQGHDSQWLVPDSAGTRKGANRPSSSTHTVSCGRVELRYVQGCIDTEVVPGSERHLHFSPFHCCLDQASRNNCPMEELQRGLLCRTSGKFLWVPSLWCSCEILV